MIKKTNPKIPYSLNDFPKVLPRVKFFTKEPIAMQQDLKAFVGWDGIVIFDSNLDILQTLKIYVKQYQNYAQSCGRCTPGKYGGKVLYELLEKLQNHEYEKDDEALSDIEKLQEVCELMSATSKCEVGKTTPNPILQILKEKPEVFAKALPLSRKKLPKNNQTINKTFEYDNEAFIEANKLQSLSKELQQSMQKLKSAKDFAIKVQQSIASGNAEVILQEAKQKIESVKAIEAQEDLKKRLIQSAQMLAKNQECDNKELSLQDNHINANNKELDSNITQNSGNISSLQHAAKDYKTHTLMSVNYGIVRDSSEKSSVFEPLERYKSAVTTHIGQLSYISKITAPCTDECPSRVDIPAYIEGVKDMRYLSSLSSTRSSMPLAQVCGRVCPHPCENACRRANLDSPISIMELKRIGANAEFNLKQTNKWKGYTHPNNIESQNIFSKKSVGVIGAGPAGLSSAYYMALRGIKVEVYEALPVLGGEVAVGVPNYRMPITAYNHDIESLKALGVIFHTNFLVDSTNIIALEEKHDALVIAVGTRSSKKLGCKNENVELEGYLPAIKFMDSVNLAQKFNIGELPNLAGKRIVCVGGGFTSMDVVRCCVRLGAASVIMLYRRDEDTIIKNTSAEEYHEACEEGVEFQFLSAVSEIIEKDSKINALKINRYELIKNDSSPKGELKLIDDGGVLLECDILIPAVSQEIDFPLDSSFGVEFSKWNTIIADEASFSTTKKGIFAAGDCVSGPLTIVNAVGHGRRVASVIANYLQTGEVAINDDEKMEDLLKSIGVFDKNREVKGFLSGNKREISSKLDPEYRAGNFEEVNLGFTNEMAITEAQRCMRCYYISMCVVGNEASLSTQNLPQNLQKEAT